MRVEEAIGAQVARLRTQQQLSLADLGEALGPYLGKPWSRQAVHQAERGQRSFTAAELTALALALDTSIQALFRAESGQIELPGRAIAPEEYRSVLLNRQHDAPLDGLEELIVALHDIGEVLQRPSLARLVRIARAAEQVTEPPSPRARASADGAAELCGVDLRHDLLLEPLEVIECLRDRHVGERRCGVLAVPGTAGSPSPPPPRVSWRPS